MRVKRKRQVKDERRAAKEDTALMEAERRAAVMQTERQSAAVELAFQISDCFQIAFRLLSDSFQIAFRFISDW